MNIVHNKYTYSGSRLCLYSCMLPISLTRPLWCCSVYMRLADEFRAISRWSRGHLFDSLNSHRALTDPRGNHASSPRPEKHLLRARKTNSFLPLSSYTHIFTLSSPYILSYILIVFYSHLSSLLFLPHLERARAEISPQESDFIYKTAAIIFKWDASARRAHNFNDPAIVSIYTCTYICILLFARWLQTRDIYSIDSSRGMVAHFFYYLCMYIYTRAIELYILAYKSRVPLYTKNHEEKNKYLYTNSVEKFIIINIHICNYLFIHFNIQEKINVFIFVKKLYSYAV